MNFFKALEKPVDKKELIAVIKQAVFLAFIGGLLIGTIDLLVMQTNGLSLIWMMLILFGVFLTKRLREVYYNATFAVSTHNMKLK